MKVSRQYQELILLGLCATVLKRRRRHHIYGYGVACRTTRNARRRRVVVCQALLQLQQKYALQRQMKPECQRMRRRWWVRPIFEDHELHGAWFTLIPTMRATDPDKFYNFHRMTSESFDKLLAIVAPYMQKISWRKSICPGERLCITLRYLASGDSMVSLSYLFRVSDQCISSIVFETTAILWAKLKPIVFPKISEDLWLKTAAEFESLWNIPHCLGAIDGRHFAVRAFPYCGSRYYNYKKFHSMILMAVCDAKLRCLMVDFGGSGRRGDSNVFYYSAFGRALRGNALNIPSPCPVEGSEKPLPFVFIGDNAFAISENLITPFKGSFLLPEERLFNYRLSRARRIVENMFGVLCSRYRIFFTSIIASRSLVMSIVLCCLSLHNWHLMQEDGVPPKERRYCPEGFADYVTSTGEYVIGKWRMEAKNEYRLLSNLKEQVSRPQSKQARLKGDEVVLRFMEYFANNSVPWQWRHIHFV